MNKRKVLSILLLALITVALAVSCSSNIETPVTNTEELAYVTFGNGHSRELNTSYQTEPYNLLYWFYTAQKTDSYGTTGVTSGETPVSKDASGSHIQGLSGRVGPFSQGAWKFKLYAYGYTKTVEGTTTTYAIDSNKLVYESDEVSVTLKGNEVKNVPVSVSTKGDYGYVRLDNVTFSWKDGNGGTAAPTGKLVFKGSNSRNDFEIKSVFQLDGSNTFKITGSIPYKSPNNFNIPADFYTVTATAFLDGTTADGIVIDNENTPLFSQTFGLRVYGNATTVISGDIEEGITSEVTFDVADQTMKVFTLDTTSSDRSTTVSVAITALNGNKESVESVAENEKTTVTFPDGALADAVHQLNVEVTPIASAEQKFQVSGTSNAQTAVSGIDLTMYKVEEQSGLLKQTPVTTFNNKSVTVTTYIATGLSNVSVRYIKSENDASDIKTNYTIGTIDDFFAGRVDGYYDSSTGKLVFKTTHFSQYVVVASVEAMNVSTGVPYTSLVDAIAAAGDGQEIQLMKDVSISSYLLVNEKITVDLNGKTVTTIGDSVNAFIVSRNGDLTIKGGSVTASGTALWAYYDGVIRIEDGSYTSTGGEAVIVGAKHGDSFLSGNLIINDGTFNSQEMTVLALGSSKVTINGGQFTANDNAVIGTNGSQCFTEATYDIEINGGTFNGETESTGYIACGIYMANRGTVTLNGGTFNINGGVGVLVRSGELIANDVTFNISSKEGLESGKVGDAKINIKTPAQIVIDTKANYPGGAPVIAVNKTSYVPKTLDGNNVVTINTKEELKNFATKVNNSTGNESTILLMADIDLQGETWTPIGPNADGNNKFKGVFHGQNHVIKNMTVDQSTVPEYRAAGFFGALNGTVMNLVFENANVKSISGTQTSDGATDNGNAIVAGSIYNSGLIKNVTVKNSKVSANRYVGGIAGYVYGNVENCTVEDTVITATPDNQWGNYDNGDKVGGIVGYLGEGSYFVKNCSVSNNTITGYRDIGGVVGYANASTTVSDNTISGGTITVDNSHNYKNYTVDTAHDANPIVGEAAGNASVTDNNGDNSVTITRPSYTN